MSLTPVDVERKLTALVSEITRAQQGLAEARNAETEADIAFRKARTVAFHSGACPKVTRGGHTVADRDSWIDAQVSVEWEALRRAETAREIAVDHLRAVLAVAETVRSLGASVRTAYAMAGAS